MYAMRLRVRLLVPCPGQFVSPPSGVGGRRVQEPGPVNLEQVGVPHAVEHGYVHEWRVDAGPYPMRIHGSGIRQIDAPLTASTLALPQHVERAVFADNVGRARKLEVGVTIRIVPVLPLPICTRSIHQWSRVTGVQPVSPRKA